MKVAKKSPRRAPVSTPNRATLTLSRETYRKIDELRGEKPRSVWIQSLVQREEERHQREQLAQTLREQYTPAVVRETLALNESLPVHDR